MTEKVIIEKLENIEKDVGVISQVLLGNGDPERSVVTRLIRLEDSVKACQSRPLEHHRSNETSKKGRVAIICSTITALSAIVVALIALLK